MIKKMCNRYEERQDLCCKCSLQEITFKFSSKCITKCGRYEATIKSTPTTKLCRECTIERQIRRKKVPGR